MNHLSPREGRGKVSGLCFFSFPLAKKEKKFKAVVEVPFAGAPLHVELIIEEAESKRHRFAPSLASFGLFSVRGDVQSVCLAFGATRVALKARKDAIIA